MSYPETKILWLSSYRSPANKNKIKIIWKMSNCWALSPLSHPFPICLWITLTQCYVVFDYDIVVKQTTENCTTSMSFLAWGLIPWPQSTFMFDTVTSSLNKNCIARFKVLRALFLVMHIFWDVALCHWVTLFWDFLTWRWRLDNSCIVI